MFEVAEQSASAEVNYTYWLSVRTTLHIPEEGAGKLGVQIWLDVDSCTTIPERCRKPEARNTPPQNRNTSAAISVIVHVPDGPQNKKDDITCYKRRR